MRKIARSSKVPSRIRLSACAEARSRPKGFSTMTRAPVGAARLGRAARRPPEQHRRDGEVVRRPLRGAEFLAERLEGRRVADSRRRRSAAGRESLSNAAGSTPAVLLEAVARAGLELLEVPAGLGHADHRHVEVAALQHRLQRRERSSCRPDRRWRRRTPARRSGMACMTRLLLAVTCPDFSTCPPNW